MCLTIRYVRSKAGDDGVARMLALAGETRTAEELEDEHRWSTYEQKIALWEAAAVVLDDPVVTRHIGESALEHRVGAGLRVLLRTLGSPGLVLSNVAKAGAKFSTVATMQAVDVGRTSATIAYRLNPDKQPHRLDCESNIGLMRVIGPLFGIPPLVVEHTECQVLGAPECRYEVRWNPRRRFGLRTRERQEHLEERLSAVSAQLESLQSTAADLVSSDDLDSVLDRIVARASVAVNAPRYLLAVRPSEDAPLSVHWDGFESETEARRAAARLLETRTAPTDLDDQIVIDVASSRRVYGRLAAFLDGHTFFPEEIRLLDAYARSAAAALDAATALESARRRGATAQALLDLARALSEVSSADLVAQKLADAMPDVVGASGALVLLWDPVEGVLTARGRNGWSDEVDDRVRALAMRPTDSPAVQALVDEPHPVFVRTTEMVDDFLRTVVTSFGVDAVASVPIRQHGELLGLAVAGFHAGEVPASLDPVLERMAGVADHAAVALRNALLLERVQHEARHDRLTGLANRALFEERVSAALARAARDGSTPALLFVDLDRFKRVNDSLGHGHGDELLQDVALRLREATRSGDELARVGGDEFAVLLHDVDRGRALQLAERIRHALTAPVELDGHPVVVSASIGVSLFPEDGRSYEDLLRHADIAMYEAKDHGRDVVREYRPGTTAPGRARITLETELRTALLEDQLDLVFQPEVDLATDRVVALEALVRWDHPSLGRITPDRFLTTVDEAGLSLALDAWVIRAACQAAGRWRSDHPEVRVAVNVCATNCARHELVDAVSVALRETGLDPTALELEITETAALDATPEVMELLHHIREMGVTFALDDFGVGYSLFGRLRDFSVSRVKIDGSFVRSAAASRTMIGAITTMSHGLGLQVVAEGIETADQLALVEHQGCDIGQGFLLSPPASIADAVGLLDRPLAADARRSRQPA
jgi:diguanylate cyclase (GGDEF)-like protein